MMRPVRGLRVATLNLWGRQGPWEARRAVVRAALAELELDALGLQEVLRFDAAAAPGAGGETSDQALELADGLGLHAAFGAALDLGFGYSFGNAILSRFAIGKVETVGLPGAPGAEPRALVAAVLHAPFGPLLFCSTHLAWRFDEGALRCRQVVAVAQAVDRMHAEAAAGFPAIVVGDFNAEPDADEIRFLRGLHVRDGASTYFIDAFGEVGAGDGATFSRRNAYAAQVGEPDRRIDYVFVRGRDPRGFGRPVAARLAFTGSSTDTDGKPVFGSDHFGVVAELVAPIEARSIL